MDEAEVRTRIKQLLVDGLALEGLEPGSIEDDASLQEELGLDSVDALQLVLGLEQEFGIKVHGKNLDRETFQSVSTLASFVRERLRESALEAQDAL